MLTLLRHYVKEIGCQATDTTAKSSSHLHRAMMKTQITYISYKNHYMACLVQRVHHTMSAYLKSQGCTTVGFELSMWTVLKNGYRIRIAAHIDDFIIASEDRSTLDTFRKGLTGPFFPVFCRFRSVQQVAHLGFDDLLIDSAVCLDAGPARV